MNLLEINSQLQELETSQDLLRWRIGIWSAWPIIRFNAAVLSSYFSIDTSNIQYTVYDHFHQSYSDISGLLRAKHPQLLLFVASTNRVEQENNYYKDIIFDDLLHYFPAYFKIESINNKTYLNRSRNALYPSQMTTSGIFLISGFLSKYINPKPIYQLSEIFYLATRDTLQTTKISRKYLRRVLSSYYWRKKLYTGVLFRLQPHLLLLQTAYTNHALVAAAKELKIKTIEFQHGIIDRHHPGYSWTAPATVYKNRMPIPDRLYVYGDYWREELASNNFWNDELRSVGSLRLDQYRTRNHIEISRSIKSIKLHKSILVTTQAMDVDRVISFLIEFIKFTGEAIEVNIKLHPRESNRVPYDTAFNDYPNVHIFLGHEGPSTFTLLSNCDYHASIHSTCHYEALGLGKPTIILPFKNHERMLPLIEKAPGCAFIANSPAEMSQIISKNHTVPADLAAFFFREDALNNILSELKHELDE